MFDDEMNVSVFELLKGKFQEYLNGNDLMVMLYFAIAEIMSRARKSLIARLKNRTEQMFGNGVYLAQFTPNQTFIIACLKSTARIIEI